MPIFDYQCQECGHEQEELITGSTESLDVICNKCGSDHVTKCIGAPAFIIHGYSAANGYASRNRFGTGESIAGEKII